MTNTFQKAARRLSEPQRSALQAASLKGWVSVFADGTTLRTLRALTGRGLLAQVTEMRNGNAIARITPAGIETARALGQ